MTRQWSEWREHKAGAVCPIPDALEGGYEVRLNTGLEYSPRMDAHRYGASWEYYVTHYRFLLPEPMHHYDTHAFKNFHRQLCDRFNYTHDEIDWRRDQVSLVEWIAKMVPTPAEPVKDWESVARGLAVHLENMLLVYSYPDRQLCCNGRECGCMGATVHQEAEHYARAALKTYEEMKK